MKRLIIFLLLFAAIKVAGQTTGYLRFDTVMIYKVGGTAELVLMNKTKDTLGLLTNYGNGRTRFIKSRAINDSTIVVGLDTLTVRGAAGFTADNGLTKTGSNIQLGGNLTGNTTIGGTDLLTIDARTKLNNVSFRKSNTGDANYTITSNDFYIELDNSTAQRTITFPSPAAANTGRVLWIADRDQSVNDWQITGSVTDINDPSSARIAFVDSLKTYWLISDGTNWVVQNVYPEGASGGGEESDIETQLRKGIGADTSTGSPIPDTLFLEEEYLYTTNDQRGVIADYYVDDGQSDSNDGQTETSAKQTLTAATTGLIADSWAKGYSTGLLRANSVFREQFTPTNNGIRLGAWALFDGRVSKLPMISASDALPSGADTASMYKITVTHSLPSGNPGYDYFVVVEIDTALEKYYPVAARRYLTIATSIANCDATAGSFYQPSMTSPTPVYINPTIGSVGSNKYRYEIAQRLSSVYSTGLTGRYTNLWLENGVSGYGTVGGTNGGVSDIYLARSIVQGGATHTSVIKSGMVEENVYVTGSLGGTNGNTGHVFYEGDGEGNYGIFRRNMMFDFEAFLLSHQGEGVNDPIEYVKYEDNYLFGDSANRGIAMGTGVVRLAEVKGNYLEYASAFYRGGAWDNRIINNVFRDIEGESGMEVPSNLSRPSTLVDNLIEFFPPDAGAIITMWSVNQDLHNVDFNHNTVYVKSLNPGGESAQVFARNSAAAGNTPFQVNYNIFISNTPTGTFTKMVTVDQNSTTGVTAGWVSDFNVYIILSGNGFRWVVTNPVGGDPNKDDLAEWVASTDQDDNSIEIDLTSNPNGLQDIFIDPANGNWTLTNSANADLIRAVMAGKRNPPTFYPKRPLVDEAVWSMMNGHFKTPSEQWQYPNYAGASSAGGTDNANVGSFYRWLKPGTQEIKTVAASNTILWDSTSNTNALTAKVDTSVIATQFDLTQVSGGGLTDTTRFWHVSGNVLGSTGKLGATTGHTTVFISHNIMRAAIRAVGGFTVGDTVGLTSTRLASFKNTTELQGVDVLGPISGVTPSINIQTAHTATANSQVLEGINLTATYATGGFTGVSVRPLNLNVSFASGTVIGRVGNIGASGTAEFRVEDPNGAVRLLSTGGVWSTGSNLVLRPASSSFGISIERSTGVVATYFDSTGQHTGGSTRALQKFRVSGNAYAASQGVTGAQAAFVAGVYQNTSTAAAGTVTHASVIGIGQSTLASTNSITTTTGSTLYIHGAPLGSSTNTITNPYALYINADRSFFGGGIQFNQGSDATGDIYYRASTGLLTRLGVGSDGNVLTLASGLPTWAAPGGGISGSGTSGRMTFWDGTSSITSDANLLYSASDAGIFSIGTTNTQGHLNIGGNKNMGSSGAQSYFAAATYTDNVTSASGTAPSWTINIIGAPTIAATNSSVSVPSATTFSIDAPVAGTNVTFSTPPFSVQSNGATAFGGGLKRSFSGIASGTTNIDYTRDIVQCNATSGNVTATLPNSTIYGGFVFTFIRTDASGNTVTINTTSSQTINGNTTYSLAAQYNRLTVVSDGSNWLIVDSN